MRYCQCLALATSLFALTSLCWGRGPHHPQGSTVVKRHAHYTPSGGEKITSNEELLHDKEHIQEHLDEIAPKLDLSKMSEAEIELYYFLLHDTDKNSKLDGLELLNAILHTTHSENEDNNIEGSEEEKEEETDSEIAVKNFDRFVELVDQVLREDDKNQDGFLDYAEYVKGRKRTEGKTD